METETYINPLKEASKQAKAALKILRGTMTYEVVIEEVRKYVILADGDNTQSVEEDAMHRFHRLAKSGELVAHSVTQPKIRSFKRLK